MLDKTILKRESWLEQVRAVKIYGFRGAIVGFGGAIVGFRGTSNYDQA